MSPDTPSSAVDDMRAVVAARYGPPESLVVARRPRPTAGPGQVLVEVAAAGVDRGVWHLLTGQPWLVRPMFGLRRPRQPVPGFDLAGRVAAVGEGVERFAPGDEVMGIGEATFAEWALAEADKLVPRPDSLTPTQAGVSMISGVTALQGLTEVGGLRSGQHVCILGGSGGVGSFAVQLARALGAEVTATASTAKLEQLSAIGAHHVIDHTSADPVDGSVRYDLIFDIGGRRSLRRMRRALTERGTLVVVGGEGGNPITGGFGRSLATRLVSPLVSQRLTMFVAGEDQARQLRLAEFLADGSVVPVVGATYPLEQAPVALADLAAGRIFGKAAIEIRQ